MAASQEPPCILFCSVGKYRLMKMHDPTLLSLLKFAVDNGFEAIILQQNTMYRLYWKP
jgi:hypothetical protein